MSEKNAEYWVKNLNLQPHPEGGFYNESYRASEVILSDHLPRRFGGNRNFSTSIYYLLQNKDFSGFHKIKSDEAWHFYAGSPLLIHMIDTGGHYSTQAIGIDIDNKELPQFFVPANTWFAAELIDKTNTFCLVGCTAAPGFDFEDFEMAKRDNLLEKFPQHEEIITKLTRD